jgi:hypothetical protein
MAVRVALVVPAAALLLGAIAAACLTPSETAGIRDAPLPVYGFRVGAVHGHHSVHTPHWSPKVDGAPAVTSPSRHPVSLPLNSIDNTQMESRWQGPGCICRGSSKGTIFRNDRCWRRSSRHSPSPPCRRAWWRSRRRRSDVSRERARSPNGGQANGQQPNRSLMAGD